MLNVKVDRKEILKAIQIVENSVTIILKGTDLELSINTEISGEINSEGKIVIKHKLIEEFLKQIADEKIELIEEQGKLTEELKASITKALKLQEVEDLYLPYKKKKKTKADIAKDQGLEPLSIFALLPKTTMDSLKSEAEKYITEEVATVEAAIEGVHLIIAQNISEDIKVREFLRERIAKYGILTSKVIEKNKGEDEQGVYQDWHRYVLHSASGASHRPRLHDLSSSSALSLSYAVQSRQGQAKLMGELGRSNLGAWATIHHLLLQQLRVGDLRLSYWYVGSDYWSYYGHSGTHALRPNDEAGGRFMWLGALPPCPATI